MTRYYYLDVSLNFANKIEYEVEAEFFKNNINIALRELFGEVGACIPIDLLKYQPKVRRAILRVPEEHYVKLRSSLTLKGRYEDKCCWYSIHKSSPLLLALQSDSREYQH